MELGHSERGEPGDVLREQERVIREIIRDGVLNHEPERPDVFRVLLSYGSKQLECHIRKETGKAGTTVETVTGTARKKNETTLLYLALQRVFQGVSNALAKEIDYTFVTENEHLILWARAEGANIFHWEEDVQDGLHVFNAKVLPTVSKRVVEKRSVAPVARRLVWDYRQELSD